MGFLYDFYYPLVNIHITMERSTMLLMGKSTISMPIFNSYVSLPEGNIPVKSPFCWLNPIKPPLNHHFPMVKDVDFHRFFVTPPASLQHLQLLRPWRKIVDPKRSSSRRGSFPWGFTPENRCYMGI